jgi:asparagine synthase (glutamine-hydrolysing)
VEYCLSLPSEWKLNNGLTRYILREAFKVDLPDNLLRRKDKYDFTDPFKSGLLARRQRLLDLTDPERHAVSAYVNLRTLERVRGLLLSGTDDIDRFDLFFIWRVAILSKWLDIKDRELIKPAFESGMGA